MSDERSDSGGPFEPPRASNGANGAVPEDLRSLVPMHELAEPSDEPIDFVAVQADDELVSALASGMAVSAPGVAGYDADDRVAAMLAAWRAEVDEEPIPELVDIETATAVVTGRRHMRRPGRRARHLAPLTAAAALLVFTIAGVSVGGARRAARRHAVARHEGALPGVRQVGRGARGRRGGAEAGEGRARRRRQGDGGRGGLAGHGRGVRCPRRGRAGHGRRRAVAARGRGRGDDARCAQPAGGVPDRQPGAAGERDGDAERSDRKPDARRSDPNRHWRARGGCALARRPARRAGPGRSESESPGSDQTESPSPSPDPSESPSPSPDPNESESPSPDSGQSPGPPDDEQDQPPPGISQSTDDEAAPEPTGTAVEGTSNPRPRHRHRRRPSRAPHRPATPTARAIASPRAMALPSAKALPNAIATPRAIGTPRAMAASEREGVSEGDAVAEGDGASEGDGVSGASSSGSGTATITDPPPGTVPSPTSEMLPVLPSEVPPIVPSVTGESVERPTDGSPAPPREPRRSGDSMTATPTVTGEEGGS